MSRPTALVALVCFVFTVSAITFAQDKAKPKKSKINDLHQEYVRACQNRFQILDSAYREGPAAVEYDELLAAHQKYVEAELELADASGKKKLLEEAIKWQRGLETRLFHGVANGTRSYHEQVEVQISRLELEIQLAKLDAAN